MNIPLNIPEKHAEEAKQAGAIYDPDVQIWYAPSVEIFQKLSRWAYDGYSAILLTPLIMTAKRKCWKCQADTTVVCPVAEKFLLPDEETEYSWELCEYFTSFSDVTKISPKLLKTIQEHFPSYKWGTSSVVPDGYYANHCTHCGAIQGDFYLHSEPDSPFFAHTPEETSQVTLVPVEAAYSPMILGGDSMGDSDDLVQQYAVRK